MNEPTSTDGSDLNNDESTTSKDLHRFYDQRHHHHYDPQASIKQPDDNPNLEHTIHGSNTKHYKNHVVHDLRTQFHQKNN